MAIFILAMLYPWPLAAQQIDLDHFDVLKSYGKIPADILNSIKKVETDYNTRYEKKKKNRKVQATDKFEVMSGYYMNELLLSGNVVFGDPIGNYVNKVADSLLVDYPELRKELRFYITRSDVGNAYSTDNGVILINVGLVARLQNEAQLAYVLAHEIVHYVKKHNITIFLEKEKVTSNKNGDYRDFSIAEKIMAINYRSKEIETMADREALAMYYAHSSYDIDAVEGVFDVLLYSPYPFTNEAFDLSLIETQDMIFPDSYLVDEVDKLKVDEDEADTLSTHPNVRKRKESIRTLIDSLPEYGTMQYLHSQQEFNDVVALARFEVIRLLLVEHRFMESMYCAGEMLHQYPNNHFLKKCFAASLYGLAAYKNRGTFSEVVPAYKDVSGEMGQVAYMLTKLSRRDLNIIALNYVYRAKQEMPNDAYMTKINSELFQDLLYSNSTKEAWFHKKSLKDIKLERLQQAQQDVADDTVTTTRRRKKHTRESKIDSTFTRFAFVDLFKDSAFVKEFHYFEKKQDSIEAVEDRGYSPIALKSRDDGQPKKKATHIERFVMCEPYIVKVDKRKKDQVFYQETEINTAKIKGLIAENAAKAGLEMDMADAIGLGEDDVQAFNDMSFVNEYISERFHQEEEGILTSFCKENIDSLMRKNQTNYLSWVATTSVVRKKPIFKLTVLSLMPYLWPYTIYQFCVPRVHTYYYCLLFDVSTGKMKFANITRVRSDVHEDQMNSHIYDFMYTLKKYHEK